MVNLTSFGSLDDKSNLSSLLVLDEMVVDSSSSGSGRDGDSLRTDSSIGEDDDSDILFDGLRDFGEDSVETLLVSSDTFRFLESNVDSSGIPIGMNGFEAFEGGALFDGEDRGSEEESTSLTGGHFEDVAFVSYASFE